jgi:hypothetical protein
MWGGREGAQVDREHDKIQDEDTTAYRGHELIGWPHDSSVYRRKVYEGENSEKEKTIFVFAVCFCSFVSAPS